MPKVFMNETVGVQTVGAGGIGMIPPVPVETVEKIDGNVREMHEVTAPAGRIPNPVGKEDGETINIQDEGYVTSGFSVPNPKNASDNMVLAVEDGEYKIVDPSVQTDVADLVADPYSTESTYAVGDPTVYENELYICNTAITQGEAWTAAHWTKKPLGEAMVDGLGAKVDKTQTVNGKALSGNITLTAEDIGYDDTVDPHSANSLGAAVGDLKSALNTLTGETIKWDNGKTRDLPNVLNQNSYQNWSSAFTTASEGDVFYVKGSGGNNSRLWIFADSTGASVKASATSAKYTSLTKIVAPSGTSYIACNSKTNDGVTPELIKGFPVTKQTEELRDGKADYSFDTIYIEKKDMQAGALYSATPAVSADNTSVVCIKKIPCYAGKKLKLIAPTVTGYTYNYRFGFYNASTGAYVSQIASTDTPEVTVPANCGYFCFHFHVTNASFSSYSFYSSFLPDAAVVTVIYESEKKEAYTDEAQVKELYDLYADPSDIVSLNKDVEGKLIQALRPLNTSSNQYLEEDKPLVLLHFSDIHADIRSLRRTIEFYNAYKNYIDDIICTGDLVATRWNDGFSWWGDFTGSEKILLAIGNHDTLTASSGFDWTQQATEADTYTRYFAPYIANWNCEYTEGKTYYYKDYEAKNVRLIVLNCMLKDSDATAQLSWLETTLAGAKTAGYTVVIANHYSPFSKKVACNFTSLDKTYGAELGSDYVSAVNSFITGGGKFACYIAGHTHYDGIVQNSDDNQFCVIVDAASVEQANQYSDTQRTNFTKSQDLENLVCVDTSSQAVKVIRVGADMDHYLRSKKQITLKYPTNTIIAES